MRTGGSPRWRRRSPCRFPSHRARCWCTTAPDTCPTRIVRCSGCRCCTRHRYGTRGSCHHSRLRDPRCRSARRPCTSEACTRRRHRTRPTRSPNRPHTSRHCRNAGTLCSRRSPYPSLARCARGRGTTARRSDLSAGRTPDPHSRDPQHTRDPPRTVGSCPRHIAQRCTTAGSHTDRTSTSPMNTRPPQCTADRLRSALCTHSECRHSPRPPHRHSDARRRMSQRRTHLVSMTTMRSRRPPSTSRPHCTGEPRPDRHPRRPRCRCARHP